MNNYTKSIFPITESKPILVKSKNQRFDFFKRSIYAEIQIDENVNAKLKQFMGKLTKNLSFSEMIQLFENTYSYDPKYISKRINYLYDVFEPDDDAKVSLDSLAGLLVFLYSVKASWQPTITLNDSGYFHLRWEKDKNNLISLEFRASYFLNYVVFMPSHQVEQPVIVNGPPMSLLDFKDFLSKLNIKLG